MRAGSICLGLALLGSGLAVLRGDAHALTTPAAGAAAKPAGLTLAAPFPCGTTYKVLCGYGCSTWHVNVNTTTKANDYHALDLIRDETGNGHGKAVVAPAAGTVKYAGWSSGGWSTYGQIVIIELDFKDGHTYQTLHAHLDKVSVSVGQHVNPRDTVGNLGRSGDSSLTYWSTSHLHFAFYRDANIGSGGPYGGVAAVPEPLDGAQDLVTSSKATVTCSGTPDGGVTDAKPPRDGLGKTDRTGGSDSTARSDGPGPGQGELPPVIGDGTAADGEGGCGCRVVGQHGDPPRLPAALLLALLALALRIRRAR